jgi:hypothetical protein
MNASPSEQRTSIIDAVKTPLGFFVLGFLIVDGTIATLATVLSDFRTQLIWTLIASIPAFTLAVMGVAIWRPEALKGDRPLHDAHAHQLASDLFISLSGALSNLEPLERDEAWITVADVLTNHTKADATYDRFSTAVGSKLRTLSDVSNKGVRTRGPVEAE